MNILYLYGLDSKLSPEKRAVLENYGNVITPSVDYYSEERAIESIIEEVKNEKIDAVIGSSMGGFAGYYISTLLEVPSLLFNPALEKRSVDQKVPQWFISKRTNKKFLLGAIDDVIDPGDTLKFLSRSFNEHTNFHIHIMPGLTHNIPVEVFKVEVRNFFQLFFRQIVE